VHDPAEIAQALATAAEAINVPRTLEDTLDAIVQAARASIPGFDHVGISIRHRDGRIETMAGTDPLVWTLDQLQYDAGQGPCVDSVRTEPVVVVEHAQRDARWPGYLPQAVELGLRAQLALRLSTEGATLGGLNLYSTTSELVDRDARQVAELFASHAAIALGRARYEHQLNEAIASRKLIGQAIGIVMERFGISEDRAFDFLVRASSTSNIKLRDVAQEVVDSTNTRYTGGTDDQR
jgi:GAF domain-containing protein